MTIETDGLAGVYDAKTPEDSRRAYDTWADSYDADTIANGYRLPFLGAGLLSSHLGRMHGPILDAGCGTGLVGEMLMLMGYHHLTGCDLSPEMIARAGQTGAYGDLQVADMGKGLPFADDHFAGFVCVGSFGPGHAPPSTLRHLARVTRPGGQGVFNLIEATRQEQGFPEVMDELTRRGEWEVVQSTQPFAPFLLSEPELLTRAHVVRIL